MTAAAPHSFYEFFAGGGLARVGLGDGWACAFANDFDPDKAAAYADNHGEDHLYLGDVWRLSAVDLPGRADLAWASSPCQDLSLAGGRAGLGGGRSSAFWGFWRLMEALDDAGRAPPVLVIENVTGLLTSHGGADFNALCAALNARGYRFGALELDAALWLPQSRPRLFIIAVRDAQASGLNEPSAGHSRAVIEAQARLPRSLKSGWIWWPFQAPPARNRDLASVLDPDAGAAWFDDGRTRALLDLMAPLHRQRLDSMAGSGERRVGALYRRVRVEHGRKIQRAEIRFDGLAGCLRTPAGGSSRQVIVVAEGERIRARLLSAREAARLMGLPETYRLPRSQTRALKLMGDAVAAPVVRALAEQILEPLLNGRSAHAA